MILFYCTNCDDLVKLLATQNYRECQCKSSRAQRLSWTSVGFAGAAIPVSISDSSFEEALLKRHKFPGGSQRFYGNLMPTDNMLEAAALVKEE